MSDPTAQQSPPSDRPGAPSDRKVQLTTTASYGYTAGVVVATLHWLVKCYHVDQVSHVGYWVFFLPDDSLIEMWAFMLLPIIHLIGRIINNHLKKLAGDEQ